MKTELTIPSFYEHVKQLEISYLVGGNAKRTVTLEKSWAVSCKIKQTSAIQHRNLTPRCTVPGEMKMMFIQNLYMNVYRDLFVIVQN